MYASVHALTVGQSFVFALSTVSLTATLRQCSDMPRTCWKYCSYRHQERTCYHLCCLCLRWKYCHCSIPCLLCHSAWRHLQHRVLTQFHLSLSRWVRSCHLLWCYRLPHLLHLLCYWQYCFAKLSRKLLMLMVPCYSMMMVQPAMAPEALAGICVCGVPPSCIKVKWSSAVYCTLHFVRSNRWSSSDLLHSLVRSAAAGSIAVWRITSDFRSARMAIFYSYTIRRASEDT